MNSKIIQLLFSGRSGIIEMESRTTKVAELAEQIGNFFIIFQMILVNWIYFQAFGNQISLVTCQNICFIKHTLQCTTAHIYDIHRDSSSAQNHFVHQKEIYIYIPT